MNGVIKISGEYSIVMTRNPALSHIPTEHLPGNEHMLRKYENAYIIHKDDVESVQIPEKYEIKDFSVLRNDLLACAYIGSRFADPDVIPYSCPPSPRQRYYGLKHLLPRYFPQMKSFATYSEDIKVIFTNAEL